MKKIIVRDNTPIPPFHEPARDLRIMNKPLWLYQRDVLSPYCREEVECSSFESISTVPPDILSGEAVVYRDNLYFGETLFAEFISTAKKLGRPAQIAFSRDDEAITRHALALQDGIRLLGDQYVADLYYYPDGATIGRETPALVEVDTKPREVGYYWIPRYMANEKRELGYMVPLHPFLSIEHWIHIFVANVPFGLFSYGVGIEAQLDSIPFMLKVLWRSLLERKQFLSSSALVVVGKNTQIDPAAIIQGPTIIGDNVTIGPGVVINASLIGNNVNIMQGAQLMLSVVGDGSYVPFRTALFMTTLMENSMVAQNTCLQACVIGRDTFIGAGNTFTDFNLLAKPIKAQHKDKLVNVELPVLGGCVGHNCRIGSGHIIYPARMIDSDVVLFAKPHQTVISKNVRYEDSDHHGYPDQGHVAQYHGEIERHEHPTLTQQLINSEQA
jgi:carbonic anhydrase/acetyltransferase-like protein (isoleucine patch superfamily)